ncbi:GTP-binding protein Rho1 [Irineochytrium annulatum]|nr:GTP-binding protein Rho1 [Irineochytrium annulatum]
MPSKLVVDLTPPPPSPGPARKVVVVGNESVGKTSLIHCRLSGACPKTPAPTVMDDEYSTIPLLGFTLTDTSGSDALDRLRPFSYEGASAFLICFSVADPRSLADVADKWIHEVRLFCPGAEVALVACKADLREDAGVLKELEQRMEKPVSVEEGEGMAARIGATRYVETSALLGVAVDEAFVDPSLSVFAATVDDASDASTVPAAERITPPASPTLPSRRRPGSGAQRTPPSSSGSTVAGVTAKPKRRSTTAAPIATPSSTGSSSLNRPTRSSSSSLSGTSPPTPTQARRRMSATTANGGVIPTPPGSRSPSAMGVAARAMSPSPVPSAAMARRRTVGTASAGSGSRPPMSPSAGSNGGRVSGSTGGTGIKSGAVRRVAPSSPGGGTRGAPGATGADVAMARTGSSSKKLLAATAKKEGGGAAAAGTASADGAAAAEPFWKRLSAATTAAIHHQSSLLSMASSSAMQRQLTKGIPPEGTAAHAIYVKTFNEAMSGMTSARSRTSTAVPPQPTSATSATAAKPAREPLVDPAQFRLLLSRCDPSLRLDNEVETLLNDVTEDLVTRVTEFACKLAKHRAGGGASASGGGKEQQIVLDWVDAAVPLEMNWGVKVAGFGEEAKAAKEGGRVQVKTRQHLAKAQAVRNEIREEGSRQGRALRKRKKQQ